MQQELNGTQISDQQLSREELQALNNKRAGLFIFQISWMMVFISLIVVNWQLRFSYPTWPPPGVEKLGVFLPTVAAVALFASSLLARWGKQSITLDHFDAFRFQWRLAIGLGIVFVGIMLFEWVNAPMGTQYGTLFRVMTGFHGIHALVIGLFMIRVYRRRIEYDREHFWPVEAAAKLWYFVAIAWVLFYLVLYWI